MEASKTEKPYGEPLGKELHTEEEYKDLQAQQAFSESAEIGHRAVKELVRAVQMRFEDQHGLKWDSLTPTQQWQFVMHQVGTWLGVEVFEDASTVPVTVMYGWYISKDGKASIFRFHNAIGEGQIHAAYIVARYAAAEAWKGRRVIIRMYLASWKEKIRKVLHVRPSA